MQPPELLPSNPPSLSDQLRRRTNELHSKIVKANYNTQFVRTAPELSDFRDATAGHVDEMDDNCLSETFRKTVHFTDYNSYAPLTAKIFEKPCKASAIVNMFAPGLPDCLTESSSTSGGLAKTFLRYNTLSQIKSLNTGSRVVHDQDPLQRRTKLYVFHVGCNRLTVLDEDNIPAGTIYMTSGSVQGIRVGLHLDPEEDEERMGNFILDHATPYAVGFIEKWRSFLLIHALFALRSRSLDTMLMVFINTFVDMIQHLDMNFDMVVDCIANGTIPDVEGIADVRPYLEMNISPDPDRAAELRRIGRPSSRPGWCAHAWPSLHSVTSIASGSFALSIPLVRRFLGPDIQMRSPGYGSTEAWIGPAYNPLVLDQFKLCDKSIFEFLDVSKSDSISALAQLWEVELGRRYEIVPTTQDGLWRYRLGDVVEICGFDPTDGIPVIRFVERRNVAIRFPDFMVTETELRSAMSSVTPTTLVNWTAAIDDRRVPATIGFFVELARAGDQETYDPPQINSLTHETHSPLPDLALAQDKLLDELLQLNANIAWALEHDKFRKPTLWLVRPGTFSEFVQLKLDEGSRNIGQVKIPAALPKPEYVTWFSEQVVQEL
ncbi:GH3 auxin-responsive promoter [Tylopilus felleus]